MNSQKMGVSDNLSCFHRTDNDIVIAYTKKSDKIRPAGRKNFFRPAAIFLRLILFFISFFAPIETETAKTFSATLTYITVAFRTPEPWQFNYFFMAIPAMWFVIRLAGRLRRLWLRKRIYFYYLFINFVFSLLYLFK